MNKKTAGWMATTVAGLALAALAANGCASRVPRRDPVGELLPTITGTSLAGDKKHIPSMFSGKPAILLIGFVQNTQFDIDRWLLGLSTLKTPALAAELPTIQGMAPTLFSGVIDNGMRRGIPRNDWAGVITLYGTDARRLVAVTGDQDRLPARVMLLDSQGRIAWFHDLGFSTSALTALDSKVRSLASAETDDSGAKTEAAPKD